MRNIIEQAGVWQSSREKRSGPSSVLTKICVLFLTGQHDRTPVTTKHEKEALRQPLFAVSYGSFQGSQWQTFCGEQGEGAIGQGPGLVGKEVLNEPVRDAIGRRRQESKWEDLVCC
jgi:hypothetical protein